MKLGGRIGWLLLAGLLFSVIFSPMPGDTRWVRTLHNSAHGPIFGCVVLVMLALIRAHPRASSLPVLPQYLISFAVAALLGVGTEVAQGFVGRDVSFSDVFHDVLGAATFLALFYVFDPRRGGSPGRRVAALAVGIALLAFLAAPVVRSAVEYRRRDERFPVLADFSHDCDLYFLGFNLTSLEHVAMPAKWAAAADESTLRVVFLDEPYPGVSVIEPPGDWSAYSTLVIDVTNPTSEVLELSLRIDDLQHNQQFNDRFNTFYRLAANTRTAVRVPLSEVRAGPTQRRLDMKNIATVFLFRTGPTSPGEMYLSRVWLE